jgi:hypothetical protein
MRGGGMIGMRVKGNSWDGGGEKRRGGMGVGIGDGGGNERGRRLNEGKRIKREGIR